MNKVKMLVASRKLIFKVIVSLITSHCLTSAGMCRQIDLDKVIFVSLADYPSHAKVIGQWLHKEWGERYPDRKPLDWVYISITELPKTYIALDTSLEQQEVVGTCCLKTNGCDLYPDLKGWLSNVYVPEDLRKQGLGKFLVSQAVNKAKYTGFQKLYLFTRKAVNLYEGLGWKTKETAEYRGGSITVMSIDI